MTDNFKKMWRILTCDMPRHLWYILTITLVTWGWLIFKDVEPIILPVVTDFEIVDTERVDRGIRIHGTMIKQRDCKFKELLTYSKGRLVDLEFQDLVSNQNISRVTGSQAWGWWLIIPDVTSLTIYVRHECLTGKVLTKLYEGYL